MQCTVYCVLKYISTLAVHSTDKRVQNVFWPINFSALLKRFIFERCGHCSVTFLSETVEDRTGLDRCSCHSTAFRCCRKCRPCQAGNTHFFFPIEKHNNVHLFSPMPFCSGPRPTQTPPGAITTMPPPQTSFDGRARTPGRAQSQPPEAALLLFCAFLHFQSVGWGASRPMRRRLDCADQSEAGMA